MKKSIYLSVFLIISLLAAVLLTGCTTNIQTAETSEAPKTIDQMIPSPTTSLTPSPTPSSTPEPTTSPEPSVTAQEYHCYMTVYSRSTTQLAGKTMVYLTQDDTTEPIMDVIMCLPLEEANDKFDTYDYIYFAVSSDDISEKPGTVINKDNRVGTDYTHFISKVLYPDCEPVFIKNNDLAFGAKPIIYLYPQEETLCSVKLGLNGQLTCTYPEYGASGWENFIAKPDGTLVFPNGREYYALYWEGIVDTSPDFSKGFCVKGEDSASFLENVLAQIGLSRREANEFIIYWLPIMEKNEYNLITFNTDSYSSAAKLEVTPTPDSILRVYMQFKGVDEFVEIQPQEFEGFERNGFTVVEWGGSDLT